MTPPRTVLAATFLSLVLAGCGQDEQTPSASSDPAEPRTTSGSAAAESEELEWSYAGDTGPQEWAELDPDYATCGAGEQQSPIDLTTDAADAEQALPPVTFDYAPATYELQNLGHTVQATADGAGGMTIGDERYELLQFHAHTPSEHALDGERSDLEVHLVHGNEQGELAVVGLLVDGGAGQSPLSGVWEQLPDEEGETAQLPSFDASLLVPDDPSLYRYDGSLTTPPCTEGVRWLVVREPAQAPTDLVEKVESILGDTARPLQPVGGREVVLSAS